MKIAEVLQTEEERMEFMDYLKLVWENREYLEKRKKLNEQIKATNKKFREKGMPITFLEERVEILEGITNQALNMLKIIKKHNLQKYLNF